jgi:hypothetical protein
VWFEPRRPTRRRNGGYQVQTHHRTGRDRRSTFSSHEEVQQTIREMLPLAEAGVLTREQLRHLLVQHFRYKVHVGRIDAAIRTWGRR